jgi:murein DD-endopeptidase MepM/ murein hydrolase activator NlpD
MARRISHYVAVGVLGAALVSATARAVWLGRRPLVAAPIVVTQAYDEFADTLHRRETLSNVLARAGITGGDYASLLAATRALNPRRLRVGQAFVFRRVRQQPIPDRVMVRDSAARRIWLERGDSGWVERVERIPWTSSRVRVAGVITSSLYEALDRSVGTDVLPSGERLALAWAIAEVYDWEVDFTRDIRPGDQFAVLIERLESPEGELRLGRVLAGRVEAAGQAYYAFAFEADSGRARSRAFYDERGRSLRRAFLRTPVSFRRISSRFGGRLHPVLKSWRNHHGIDYAANAGSPVRATADGLVTRAGRDGGYGNLVELRHVNGIRTRYGHLSGFAKGVRVGARVAQGETIGFVGSTGLSTGPHLHYEFLVNGRATNPQRRDMGTGQAVPAAVRGRFARARADLQAELEPPVAPAAGSVVRVD